MRLPVHIWIREVNASPAEIAGYFMELARHLDEQPRKMRLKIDSTVPVVFDFDPSDGNPAVTVGGETVKFKLRHRWIPEHDVPLELGPVPAQQKRCTTLLIDPVEENRFRVRAGRAYAVPEWMYALTAVVGMVAVITLHPVVLGVAAVLFLLLFLWLLPLWYNSRFKLLIKRNTRSDST